MASGALNYGPSSYFFAIPFAVYALTYARNYFDSHKPLMGVAAYLALLALLNATLETNPLVFPILRGGYVQEVQKLPREGNAGAPDALGNKLRITGLHISHADLETRVILTASDGQQFRQDHRDPLLHPYPDTGNYQVEWATLPARRPRAPCSSMPGT